jgi:hypothetical protein
MITQHDATRCDPSLRLFNSRSQERAQLIRPDGTVVHEWVYEQGRSWHYAEMLSNGNLVAVDKGHGVLEIDRDSQLVWRHDTPAHHDFARKADGNTYVLSGRTRQAERMRSGRELFYDCLHEVTPGGEVVWRWHAEEHANELGLCGPLPEDYTHSDWPHINTCEVLPVSPAGERDPRFAAGNLLMCGRIIDTIWVVDRATGRVTWTWGPGELIGPHMPTMLPTGNLLIYDNGSVGDRNRGYSRIVELDPLAGRIVWQYVADPPQAFYSPSRGSCERLPSGNHLIAESDSGRLFEVADDGQVVWEYQNELRRPNGTVDPIYRVKAYLPETMR